MTAMIFICIAFVIFRPSSSEPDSALNGGDRLTGFGDMVEALPPAPLGGSKQSSVEILPLTDVFVPLETIQPGILFIVIFRCALDIH